MICLLLTEELGVGGLVKQLREPGVDGAPLLFHAATNIGCLGDVTKVYRFVLDAFSSLLPSRYKLQLPPPPIMLIEVFCRKQGVFVGPTISG